MKPLPDAVNAGAWLLGETAFTTLRTHRGLALLWEAHLTRLSTTCAFLGLPVPEGERPPLDPLPWGLLRLTVTPEGTFWSHRPLHPGPRPAQGVTVRVTGVQVHPQLAAHKTGSALPYRLAGREAAQAGPSRAGCWTRRETWPTAAAPHRCWSWADGWSFRSAVCRA